MSYQVYHVAHLFAVLLLVGNVFWALSDPSPEKRKSALKWSGIISLVALASGFGLLARIKAGFPLWVTIKLVCWLVLTGMVGIAFRKQDKRNALLGVTVGLVLIAVVMVSLKPF